MSFAHHPAGVRWALLAVVTAALGVSAWSAGSAPAASSGSRPMGGQNEANTRFNRGERMLGTANVGQLAPKWTFTAVGGVSATPAVVGGALYFPDWGGSFYKVDAGTG